MPDNKSVPWFVALGLVIVVLVAIGGGATQALLVDNESANATFVGNTGSNETITNDAEASCSGNVGNTCDDLSVSVVAPAAVLPIAVLVRQS